MEEKSRKREWIKNIAIIFLAILLVLTFFSNTILNYSLPEVSTYSVTAGNITVQVRGTGMVEAVDPYQILVKESRKVSSVAVRVDSRVEVGDVLYYLSESESDELLAAQNELEQLEAAYEKAILQGGFTKAEVASVENGTFGTIDQFQAQMENYNNAIDAWQKNVDTQQSKVDDIQRQIDILSNSTVDTSKETKALQAAQKEYKETEAELNNKRAYLATLSETDPLYEQTKKEVDDLSLKLVELEGKVSLAQLALDQKTGNSSISKQISELSKQKVNEEVVLRNYQNELEKAKTIQSEKLNEILGKIELAETYRSVADKRAEVKKLREDAMGGTIVSPVAGKITSLGYVAGETTSPDIPAAVIQMDGKGYTLSFPVSIEQSKRVRVGSPVSIVDGWWYSDVVANLVAIQTDTENPRQNRILKFELTGESILPGESLTLSIGEKSSQYDHIVPNNAIREDNNGKFVLKLQSKSTPFGNRYIAKRVNIEVLASDDNYSAISADDFTEYGDSVITTSSEPIKNGQQVRLAPNTN